jgi:hypothetical protein
VETVSYQRECLTLGCEHLPRDGSAFCEPCKDPGAWAAPPAAPDPVSHPPHYTNHPSGIECIDVVEHMNFNRGNAIKYLWRAGLKGETTELQDLSKARWYIDREIKRLGGK